MRILDLGCGTGRWANVLDNKKIEYVGIDFSNELIYKAKKKSYNNKVDFLSMPAQDYFSKDKFDLIFLFGLIPYMNDDEIKILSNNCFNMLKDDGKLLLRDVLLDNQYIKRKVYDDNSNLIKRFFFKRPRYQVIRRSTEVEIDFFKDFKLVHKQMIEGTNLNIKILKK